MDLDEHENSAAAPAKPEWVLLGDSGMMLRVAARPPAPGVSGNAPRANPADRDESKERPVRE